jgi:hypothetical protein
MVLRQRLEDKGVHVEFPRKARKQLDLAQRRLQKWQALMEGAELLERQDREQRELLQRLGQEPRELRGRHVLKLGELDRRHNREREEVGLPPREWLAQPWAAEQVPLVSLHQMFDADLDQVGISLRCTGAAGAIAETVEEFRAVVPGCEVEVLGESHSTSTAQLVSRRRIFGAHRRQVSQGRRSSGAAAAMTTQTVAPPVPRAGARCTATTRAGARCKLKAGPDGLCPLHQPQGPQIKAAY